MRGVTGAAALILAAALAAPAEPGPDLAGLIRAEALMEQRDYRGAEAVLRKVLEADPANARAHGNLALALLEQKRTREAIDAGRLAAAFAPDRPEARYIYGLALSAGGRPVDAAREFEKSVAAKPDAPGPLGALAAAYAATGDERTAATYEKLIVVSPDDRRARVELSEYLWRIDRHADGNRVITEARKAFPDDADLALRQGRAFVRQDLAVDAVAALEAARRLGAGDAGTFALLASAYARTDVAGGARSALEAGIAAHPEDASLQHDLGRLLLSEGLSAEALPYLQKAASSARPTAAMETDLGRALEALGRPAEAEAAYRRAIRLSPGLAGAHFALGRLLQRQGRKDEAQRELAAHRELYERGLERVAAADARSAELNNAWAELNHGSAVSAFARFQALPETAEVLRGRALALSRMGRHREAIAALERALELAPGEHQIELLLVTERSRAGTGS
jgi:Flp pilus assembly protein TadD